jgi:hypothetical protein
VTDHRYPAQVDRDTLALQRLQAAAHVVLERLAVPPFAEGRVLVERKEHDRAAPDQMLDPGQVRSGINGPGAMDEDDQGQRLPCTCRSWQRVAGHEQPGLGQSLTRDHLLQGGHATEEGLTAAGTRGRLRWRLRWGRGGGGRVGRRCPTRCGQRGSQGDQERQGA